MEAQFKAVKQHEDTVWITTFEKAVMYHKEKAKSTIEYEKRKHKLIISINNALDESKYFEPVTVLVNGISFDSLKSIKVRSSKEKIIVNPQKGSDGIKFDILPFDKEILIEL